MDRNESINGDSILFNELDQHLSNYDGQLRARDANTYVRGSVSNAQQARGGLSPKIFNLPRGARDLHIQIPFAAMTSFALERAFQRQGLREAIGD